MQDCTDPTKWGFTIAPTPDTTDQSWVIFQKIGESNYCRTGGEFIFLSNATQDAPEAIEGIFEYERLDDEGMSAHLEGLGFVKDHPDAMAHKQSWQDEGLWESDEDSNGTPIGTFVGAEPLRETPTPVEDEETETSDDSTPELSQGLSAPVTQNVDPTKWGFATHEEGDSIQVVFSIIEGSRSTTETELQLLSDVMANAQSPVEKAFITADPDIAPKLVNFGFVENAKKAISLLKFFRAEGMLEGGASTEFVVPSASDDGPSGFDQLKATFGDSPSEPTGDDDEPKSLSELMAEQSGATEMKCPKCGGTQWLNTEAKMGHVSKNKKTNAITRTCANCMSLVVDPELQKLFGEVTDISPGEYFSDPDFEVTLTDDQDNKTVGPYHKVIPNYFAGVFGDGTCVDTGDKNDLLVRLALDENNVVALEIDIPPHKYEAEDGSVLVEWNKPKRFMTLGTLELEGVEEDMGITYTIEYVGEAKSDTDIDLDATNAIVRPPAMQFTLDEIRITHLESGVEVESNAAIKRAYLKGIVGIDLHNLISPINVMSPGVTEYCQIECELHNGNSMNIVTDGDEYWRVQARESDGKMEIYHCHDMDIGFGADDRKMINAILNATLKEEDTTGWYDN